MQNKNHHLAALSRKTSWESKQECMHNHIAASFLQTSSLPSFWVGCAFPQLQQTPLCSNPIPCSGVQPLHSNSPPPTHLISQHSNA